MTLVLSNIAQPCWQDRMMRQGTDVLTTRYMCELRLAHLKPAKSKKKKTAEIIQKLRAEDEIICLTAGAENNCYCHVVSCKNITYSISGCQLAI